MRKKIFISLLMILFLILLGTTFSKAAIIAASQEVETGGDIAIVVKSDTPISAYTVTVTSYNGLTFTTSSGGTGAGTTTISDAKATGTMTTLATFRFKAPTVTETTTYTVSFKATGMGDANLNPVANSECSATVKVKAPQNTNPVEPTTPTAPNTPTENNNTSTAKSSEARLANLGIKPNDFKGFKRDTYSYDIEVPNDVEKVNVYASLVNDKAKITSGTGNANLKEGLNKVEVVVTAEDGTKKTYTLNITRAKATATNNNTTDNNTNNTVNNNTSNNNVSNNETTKPVVSDTENNKKLEKESKKPTLKTLEIEGLNILPSFNAETYEYKANLNEDLTELKVIAKSANEKIKPEVAGNTNLKNGENVITILLHDEENDEIVTYQVIINKQFSEQPVAKKVFFSNWNPKDRTMFFIFSGMAFVIIIVVILLLVIKKREDEEIEIMGLLPGGEQLQEAINEHFEVMKNNEIDEYDIREHYEDDYESDYKENYEENYEENYGENYDEKNYNNDDYESFSERNTSYYDEKVKEQSERTSNEISAIQEFFNNSNEEEYKPRRGRGKHF